MSVKKVLLTYMFLGTFLLFYPSSVSAMSSINQSETKVGILILKSDTPPTSSVSTPPSPTIYVSKTIQTGRLPQTGLIDSYFWIVVGIILLILTIYTIYFFRLQNRKRGMVNEK